MGFNDWQSTSTFEVSGAPLMTLENRGERIKRQKSFSRLTVPITAAGLQGE